LGNHRSFYYTLNSYIMNQKKFIGINQRIPFLLLENALLYAFRNNSNLNDQEVVRDISEHFEGKNSGAKRLVVIRRIITGTPFAQQVLTDFTEQTYLQLQNSERKTLVFLLLIAAYPITFDLLAAMVKTLRVQQIVTTSYIHTQLTAKYGSNRPLFVAVGAVIPMLIEIGVFSRQKIACYTKNEPLLIYNSILAFYLKLNFEQIGILETCCKVVV
jgi:hypothetical protein